MGYSPFEKQHLVYTKIYTIPSTKYKNFQEDIRNSINLQKAEMCGYTTVLQGIKAFSRRLKKHGLDKLIFVYHYDANPRFSGHCGFAI